MRTQRETDLEDEVKRLTAELDAVIEIGSANAQKLARYIARVDELEAFVMAEGDCHISAAHFKQLESELECLCDVKEAALDVWRKLHHTEDLDALGAALETAATEQVKALEGEGK